MVERFASREPDHRLARLAAMYALPSRVRALDLGCAGGRNAVLLARLGFRVTALDSSRAMVVETRRRLAEIVGDTEASSQVRKAGMDSLEGVADASVDLFVALGIFHQAESEAEWNRALAEARRVCARGAWMLAACFTDESDPHGTGLLPVAGEPHIFEGLEARRVHLVSADVLDREMAQHGFLPVMPTETVRVPVEGGGRRVTANSLYVRA
jgi:cyclopropane fatty-acyl-phospholipid synthase-like methyltransferase